MTTHLSLGQRPAWFAICVAWLALPPASLAASFDCEKAGTHIERAICKDQELSDLDEYLGRYYAAARSELRHAAQCLASDQKSWLRGGRDACKDAACLKKAYLLRLSELDGVQPGATALKRVQLPSAPTLVGILPPARDQVAAPRRSNLKTLSVQGKLVNEVATGDGYVVLTQGGRKHLIVSSMFLDDSTAVLESLGKETAANHLIRGHAEAGASGQEAFAQSGCRYIYRVPR